MQRIDFYRLCRIYSDLALEAHDLLRGATRQEVPGVKEDKETYPEATVTTVTIFNNVGEQALGKPQGTYITIEAPVLLTNNPPAHENIANILGQKISYLLQKHNIGLTDPILVVGLGNWEATPDSLGPRIIRDFTVTQHLFKYAPQSVPPGTRPVSAISPGVLGTTGIETADIIRGIIDKVKTFKAIIAIDALAAGDLKRIGTNIQVCDTGINPGSGIGSQRLAINQQNMGVPVIAIGIPTVVHAGVIIFEALEHIKLLYPNLGVEFPQQIIKQLIAQVLRPFGGNLVVTPKEIDELIHNQAWVIGAALNQALHKTLLQTKAAILMH
ncbi:MAG: spore protease [Clostridia bacterium]|nr:spore protease [Clostridia bacterium]